MRGKRSTIVVPPDYNFWVSVRDTPLHVPSPSRAEEGVCEDLPPRVPKEVGGSPALQLYHIVKDDGERRVGCWRG